TVVLPFLRQQGIRRLDQLVLSHAHLDHFGGIESVREGIAISKEIGTDHGMPCRAGDRWQWDGVQFEFLHPDDGRWPINEGSCVLRVSAGAHALLLTGDIEAAAEAHLLETSPEKLVADVIVVPHHGSRSSSTSDFVAAVNPRYALVPAGWANRWGFPKAEVRERYEASGAQVETTGTHGALQLRMSPAHGVEQLTRWREQSRCFWRAGG
ncbi:MAG: ComEC/Rec2 family competence protein, partial [Nevskiales bacterium]